MEDQIHINKNFKNMGLLLRYKRMESIRTGSKFYTKVININYQHTIINFMKLIRIQTEEAAHTSTRLS